jgi:hypothetical protein
MSPVTSIDLRQAFARGDFQGVAPLTTCISNATDLLNHAKQDLAYDASALTG